MLWFQEFSRSCHFLMPVSFANARLYSGKEIMGPPPSMAHGPDSLRYRQNVNQVPSNHSLGLAFPLYVIVPRNGSVRGPILVPRGIA
jgi:hypothetical protein